MSISNPDTSTYGRVQKEFLDWLPTRRTLIERLKDKEDDQSWNQFFSTYSKLIFSFAMKTGLTREEAQEVVQETVISFSKNSEDFNFDPQKGSFKAWLLRLTRWRIKDQFRKRSRDFILGKSKPLDDQKCADGHQLGEIEGIDLNAVWEEEWRSNLLALAVERVKKIADPRHYQAFEYHVIRNMSPATVQARLGINRGLLYVYKHRISKMIREELNELEKKG